MQMKTQLTATMLTSVIN